MGSMLLNWAICFMAFNNEFNNACGILRTKFCFLLSKYPCSNNLNIYFIRSFAYNLDDKILRIKVVFYLPISNQMNPCLIVLVGWLHCKGTNHIKVSLWEISSSTNHLLGTCVLELLYDVGSSLRAFFLHQTFSKNIYSKSISCILI